MLAAGQANKVIIHVNEDTSAGHDYLYNDILAFLLSHGVSGATLIRSDGGFGSHHRTHISDSQGVAGQHMPVRIEFIESPATVATLLPLLANWLQTA